MEPLYYRFVVSPSTGKVTLAHNEEGHKADARYHGQLALELNEPGLIHGYAHRLGNGWRLLDYESKPFTDPWVVKRVTQKLGQEEPVEPSQTPAITWGDLPDFTRSHYGIPVYTKEAMAPEPTEDPDDEKWDDLYSGWASTHDYDPRWSYSDELRPEWHSHPLVQAAQTRLHALTGGYGRVFAADLAHRDAVGMYAFGTANEPAIFLDPYQHEVDWLSPEEQHDQAMRTVDHEYRHAQQEQMAEGEPDWDERDAEGY